MDKEVIIDSFLDDFDYLREFCDTHEFPGATNPVDDVFYPGVSVGVPDKIKSEIKSKVSSLFGRKVIEKAMFFRLSTLDTHDPHKAHTDKAMSSLSMMLYLNRIDDCIGGTSFVMHKKTGMSSSPINARQSLVWQADTNKSEAWQITSMCDMMPNRALFFDSNIMHMALPSGGFGSDSIDGRLVLVFFFDLGEAND
jgi:hypothetical protein